MESLRQARDNIQFVQVRHEESVAFMACAYAKYTGRLGMSHRIGGFTYLPRQDDNPNGIVGSYRFETSTDGVIWTTNIVSGTFANIRNNPSLQEVTFAPVNARFFRFTALQEINRNGWTSAAEISVLPAGASGD